jgi:hypothetical protein
MATSTGSRLAQANAEYERATARMAYFTPPNMTFKAGTPPKAHLAKSPGGTLSLPAINDDSRLFSGSPGQWDANAERAYAAGRTLQRCIVEHRFGRGPVRHKWYDANGEIRISKEAAAAWGTVFPESTPWLP